MSSDASDARSGPPLDPVLRNTLRYTLSAREYAALHKYILSRNKRARRNAPTPAKVERLMRSQTPGSDYNARTVRHALRVFVTTWLGMKGFEAVTKRMGKTESGGKKQPFYKSPALRLSLSLSTILLLYRFLFRFLTRLRLHLLDPSAQPFRVRNPMTSKTLTSPYAPSVGASMAGLALGIYPSQQMRVTVAIYALFRALEFGWNLGEREGIIWGAGRERPWWFGSWMLSPFAFGQLMHAMVFDRETIGIPSFYGKFLLQKTSESGYIIPRPSDLPARIHWPSVTELADSLKEMARLSWPPYISPTLFPKKPDVLPPTLTAISPITSRAHPLITSLSCATLHPSDPSCLRTNLTYFLSSFTPFTRSFLVLYSLTTLFPRLKHFHNAPLATLQKILTSALRTSTALSASLSTAWASLCFFQTYLPRHVLATQRFFLGGFLAGLWSFVERGSGRAAFLYSARMSLDSFWKVGVKRRWWKGMKAGDVWVFVAALMVTGVVYERDARNVEEGGWRKGMSWVRGEGWRDWGADEEVDEEKEA